MVSPGSVAFPMPDPHAAPCPQENGVARNKLGTCNFNLLSSSLRSMNSSSAPQVSRALARRGGASGQESDYKAFRIDSCQGVKNHRVQD